MADEDLTEPELKQVVQQLRAQLAAKQQEVDRYFAALDHDLSSPLRRVHSFAQMVRETNQDPELDEDLGLLVDQAARVRHLVAVLQRFAKVVSVPPSVASHELRALAESSLANVLNDRLTSRAEVQINELPSWPTDAERLGLVFINLLENALLFQPPDNEPRVRIDYATDEAGLTVSVSDNGIGIPEDQRTTVFQAFRRLHSPHQYPGAGLGLYHCARLMDELGGRIGVAKASASDMTTTAWFTLPA